MSYIEKANQQGISVLIHIAGKLCEYHKGNIAEGQVDECAYCNTAMKVVAEAFLYGKMGRIPLSLAEKVMDGSTT